MRKRAALALVSLLVGSCGGGSGGGTPTPAPAPTPSPSPSPTDGMAFAIPAREALTSDEVGRIVAQAAGEAQARGAPAVIAVVDRVGNVLAVFKMPGARDEITISPAPNGESIDIQGLKIDSGGAAAAAIAKAITGAYLSSGGNAFSTRTASQIVQQHFPPAPSTVGLESGPLFGVQFSQLPCSDLSARYAPSGADALIGPKRSPLGLSADPGGLPLYKNGVLVGGIGVMGDGDYGFDPDILDTDKDNDEYAALAGTVGFAPSAAIMANRITVDGTSLRYSDATPGGFKSNPASTSFVVDPANLFPVRGYYADGVAPRLLPGQAYGSEASGIRRIAAGEFGADDAFVLSNGSGGNRFPIRGATDGADVAQPITAAEARAVLESAFAVMRRARGQIRQPLDSQAQVSVAVVDTRGVALGLVRAPDAPIFGTDVALQKARTAAFFSGVHAGRDLDASTSADVRGFAAAARAFLGADALTGKFAFTDRANGNLSRPYFPDGEVDTANGPFSRPIAQFNPFSTGLQSALIFQNLAQQVGALMGGAEVPQRCGEVGEDTPGHNRIQNGIQIFPGSVPIYRGSTLVGGIGVSGDGIDQDDMISFLGLANAGLTIGNAPAAIRADRIVVKGVRLRYVNCPFAPFLDTADQNVCSGK